MCTQNTFYMKSAVQGISTLSIMVSFSVDPSIYLSIYLSIHPSIYTYIYLSIHMSFYLTNFALFSSHAMQSVGQFCISISPQPLFTPPFPFSSKLFAFFFWVRIICFVFAHFYAYQIFFFFS